MDEDTFDQATQFRPERHLDSTGRLVKHPLIPFGICKRSCFGEILAHQELFLFASMLKFKFVLPKGTGEINQNGIDSIIYSPNRSRFVFYLVEMQI